VGRVGIAARADCRPGVEVEEEEEVVVVVVVWHLEI